MKVEVDFNRTKCLIHLVLVGRGRVFSFFFLADSITHKLASYILLKVVIKFLW